jgi:hypothetical protein
MEESEVDFDGKRSTICGGFKGEGVPPELLKAGFYFDCPAGVHPRNEIKKTKHQK